MDSDIKQKKSSCLPRGYRMAYTFIPRKIRTAAKERLTELVNTGLINMESNLHGLANNFNIDCEVLDAILSNFERLNLCRVDRFIGGRIDIVLNAEAHDLVRLGGFTAQDELLKKNIEKLLLELENLRHDFPEKAERIAAIIGGISSALALFIR